MQVQTDLANQRSIDLSKFIDARTLEIDSTMKDLENKMHSNTKLAFQLLPRHQKRRTMSHNRYRVPYYMRSVHQFEKWKSLSSEKQNLKKKRVKCKSHNRKHGIIQSDRLIMPTHIYNAKRFLIDNNEYDDIKGIPMKCRQKQFRVAYKFAEYRAIAIDLSMFVLQEGKDREKEILSYGGKKVGRFWLFDRRIAKDFKEQINGRIGAIGLIGKEALRPLGKIVKGSKGRFFRTIEDIEQYPANNVWALEAEVNDEDRSNNNNNIDQEQLEENLGIGGTIKQIIEWKEDENEVNNVIESLFYQSKQSYLSIKQKEKQTIRGEQNANE